MTFPICPAVEMRLTKVQMGPAPVTYASPAVIGALLI